MSVDRREFLQRTMAALAAGTVAAQSPVRAAAPTAVAEGSAGWSAVRAAFALDPELIHMSAMLFASHPAVVRDAIERHRAGLDADPVGYLQDNNTRLTNAAFSAAARYLGTRSTEIALTDSTTMGAGLVYNGLRLKPGEEILSTEQDYYVTHEAIRESSSRTGASVRKISLYDRIDGVTEDGIVAAVTAAVKPETRVLALTWVHSSTGLKLPLRAIADAIAGINNDRAEADHVLFGVDGVHGFGNQDVTFADLGCDFFIAGCHKWLFGPRGTGLIAATKKGRDALVPSIPTFTDDSTFSAWLSRKDEIESPTTGRTLTPGGFKPFEHVWALGEAFAFQESIGKARVAAWTTELATNLKDGLAAMPHIRLVTPRTASLSAGIVSFDVEGWSPRNTVRYLRQRRIVASVAPYREQHVRLSPSIVNTPDEVERVLVEIAAMTD